MAKKAKGSEAKVKAVEDMRAWRKEMKEARRNKKLEVRKERGDAAKAANANTVDGAATQKPAQGEKRKESEQALEEKVAKKTAVTKRMGEAEVQAAKKKKQKGVENQHIAEKQADAASSMEDPEALKVVVAGIPFHITEDRLKDDFEECGEVVSCRLLKDRTTGKSRGIAFVSFATQEALDAALAYHGEDYGGRNLTVEIAKKTEGKGASKGKGVVTSGPGEKPEGCTSVIVKGLEYSVTEEDLMGFFKACGDGPQHINMLRDRETGAFRGIAFVDFDDGDAVDEAIQMHGSMLKGRCFSMDYAPPRQKSRGPGKKPEGCTSVVVKGLAFTATEASLKKTFAGCGGGPTGVRLKTDKATGEPTGIAFLDFATSADVDEAVKLSGSELKGRPFKVEFATGTATADGGKEKKKGKKKPPGCTSVVVKGLASSITESFLMKKFRSCDGGPRNVNFVPDKDTGQPSGSAFVNFSSEVITDGGLCARSKRYEGYKRFARTVGEATPGKLVAKLIDFGASTVARNCRPGEVRGKKAYQAPEMHLGAYGSFEADNFALGVVLLIAAGQDYPWKSTEPGNCTHYSFFRKRGFKAFLKASRSRKAPGSRLADLISSGLVDTIAGLLQEQPAWRMSIGETCWESHGLTSFWDMAWAQNPYAACCQSECVPVSGG